jgi:hypothetical protein
MGTAASACAAGWHWCKAEEVGDLPSTALPGMVGGTCSWLDSTQIVCGDRRNWYGRTGCTGAADKTLSAGGPNVGTLPCTGVDLGCAEPWKFAVSLDKWGSTSLRGTGTTCLDHVAFQCVVGTSCWITCCKD